MRTVKYEVFVTMPETDSHGNAIPVFSERAIRRVLEKRYGFPTFKVVREKLPRIRKRRVANPLQNSPILPLQEHNRKPPRKPKANVKAKADAEPKVNPVFLRNVEWVIKYVNFYMEVYEKGTNELVPLNNGFTEKELEFWRDIYPQSKFGYVHARLAECIVAAHNIRIGKWNMTNPRESLTRVRIECRNLERFDKQ